MRVQRAWKCARVYVRVQACMRACETRTRSCIAGAVHASEVRCGAHARVPVVAKDRAERAKLKPPHDQLPKRRVRPLQRSSATITASAAPSCAPCRASLVRPHDAARVEQCSLEVSACDVDLWAAVASNVSRPVAAQRDEAKRQMWHNTRRGAPHGCQI